MLNIGDRITVQACASRETEQQFATVLSVESYGYTVHIDGDDPEWSGPVDFDGNILMFM